MPTLNVDSPDPGPVYGSLIDVNNAAVEVGLYGGRPISIPSQRIHVACNTSTTSFADFTRWFQTDGNTHMLRVFVDDENTATARTGTSSHTEAFMGGGWNYTDNMTYEWTARYTIAKLEQGYACFQLKNTDNDWAFQLSMGSSGTLAVNNRNGTDVTVTNPDGTAKNFDGRGFDVRVLDDGLNYKVWIDGVLYASSSFSRPTGSTTFRWGMYFGANNLNPPADFNIVLVSGAQVRSWPGNLNTATTTVTKADNATSLNNVGSWVGGVVPGIYNQALWSSTIAAANTTSLGSAHAWAGIKVVSPGGLVTLNGTSILSLDDAGVDLSTATQNLDVNCPVQLMAPGVWNVAANRSATFDGIVSGYAGLTLNGAGSVRLSAANTYTGDTTVTAGKLIANHNSALGTGRLVLNGGNLSNTATCSLGNEVSLSANAAVSVGASLSLTFDGPVSGTGALTKTGTGTLILSNANAYTGSTTVSAGTLALADTSALLSTSSLSLAGGTVLQPRLDGVVVSAPISVGSSGTSITISAPTNAPGAGVVSTLTLRSVMSGAGDVTFLSSTNLNSLNTVYLGAPSTYTGSTLINTTASTDGTTTNGEEQIVVKLGVHNALPVATVLTIDGGNGSGSGRFAELNLNGFNQQLAGLTNLARSGAKGVLRIQRVVNSSVSAPATLTIHNSSDFNYSGILGGSGNGSVSAAAMPGSSNGNNFGLTKNGAGIFTLSGANTYTGTTNVIGGTLALGAANVLANTSNIVLGNATLNVATFTDTVGTLDVTAAATINLGTGATLAFANSSAIDWSGGTLTITGTFVSGASLRFGTNSSGLTSTQLALISAPGFQSFALDASGYLTAVPIVAFTTWASGTFAAGATIPADKRGPNDDPDNDGLRNLLEYALAGQDPTVANTNAGFLTGTTLSFTKRAGVTGLTYRIQASTDLGVTDPWTEVSGGSYVNNATTIAYTFSLGAVPKYFLRLSVQSN